MQDCGSPASMQCGDCCRVQPSNAPLLPESATAAHSMGASVPPAAPAALLPPASAGDAIRLASDTPTPPGSPAAGSVLRI